jgi:uncharacterized protein (UPF0264 family)
MTTMRLNQRLLISVYDAQEAREAMIGGARVVDCEDPAGALGDISPRRVMAIADAVIGYKRDLEVQISTNIGENQMLFRRDDQGRAIQRFPGEIAGKAAQAALGVAAAMGRDIHPVNIVKVGLDGMPRDVAAQTLAEVVTTLDRSQLFSRSQVVAVFFTQDLADWTRRSTNKYVVRDLLLAREYVVDQDGDIDIATMFAGDAAALAAFKDKLGSDRDLYVDGTLKPGVRVRTTRLNNREVLGFSDDPSTYLAQVAQLTAAAGADGVMIDTRIHTKVARMCCLRDGTDDQPVDESGLPLRGIHTIDQIARFARYCHGLGLEFWASGSIQPFQAQRLWDLDDGPARGLVDAMAVRSGASAAVRAPDGGGLGAGGGVVNRASKRVYRDLVAAYAPKST